MSNDKVKQLDVTGICCPWPLVRLAQTVREMRPGEHLCITGNDPLLQSSVTDYCKAQGHTLVEITVLDKRRLALRIQLKG
jgi:TusA-related sulfurtransferase